MNFEPEAKYIPILSTAPNLNVGNSLHPCDRPEGVTVPVIGGLERYLGWVSDQCDSLG